MKFKVEDTKQGKPLKTVLYGVEGIGKTTFASQFPGALFIDTEGSTSFVNAKKAPDPTSWTMLLEELEWIKYDKPATTVIVDTADWAETLAKRYLMNANHWKAIDSSSYGARYVALSDEMGKCSMR